MSRRTTKINLQARNPEEFLTLCESIVAHNNTLGGTGPLDDASIVDMAQYANLVTLARQKREEALDLYAQAVTAMNASRNMLGIGRGQTINTEDTLLYHTSRIKQLLQLLNTHNPEALSLWGFNVVVRMSKNPKRKKTS